MLMIKEYGEQIYIDMSAGQDGFKAFSTCELIKVSVRLLKSSPSGVQDAAVEHSRRKRKDDEGKLIFEIRLCFVSCTGCKGKSIVSAVRDLCCTISKYDV